MALIEVDPKQNKVVVLLIVILVAAIGVTAYRMHHPVAAKASSDEDQAQSRPASELQAAVTELTVDRNPFRRPKALAADDDDGENPMTRPVTTVSQTPSPMSEFPMGPLQIAPLEPEPAPGSKEQHSLPPPDVLSPAEEPPDVKLLATVGSGERLCAVIRIGSAGDKVVGVGDAVEGGYSVSELSKDRMLLSRGTEKLVVNREKIAQSAVPRRNADG